jgi:tRNA modification GTPase
MSFPSGLAFAFPPESFNLKPVRSKNALKSWMVTQIQAGFDTSQETIVTNVRHLEALEKSAASLHQAQVGLETNITGDFVAMDIRQAMFHLGQITGDISTDDLLGNIFAKFCIGK